jgi:hypothetical protein
MLQVHRVAPWFVLAVLLGFAAPALPAVPLSAAPVPVALEDVRLHGELGTRLEASFTRLEEEKFRPPKLFDEPNEGWPGDLEGRTMLGLILLSRVTGREAACLEAIMDLYPQRVNARGYLGPVLDPEDISEQALGAQFWDLRALLEYSAWKGDPRSSALADSLARNFYLPHRGAFAGYPISAGERESDGSQYGSEVKRIGRWRLSSDIGCGFGGLDGLTDYYSRRPSPEIGALIDEMIGRFREERPETVRAQLHSTLTATRAVLRHYETTGRPDLLRTAVERYDLYRTRAMTDTHENHNWFGKPWWTEPCAVIDSFILSVSLWRHTLDPRYLEDAHHSYYNGLAVEQRANGGFGCNSCASVDTPYVEIRIPEAHWCCTGRGAEGLARAAQFCFFTDFAGTYLPFYQDGEATLRWGGERLKLRETTGYPREGRVTLEVLDSTVGAPHALRLFAPSWAERPVVKVNGKPVPAPRAAGFLVLSRAWRTGDTVELSFAQRVRAVKPVNRVNGAAKRDYRTFHYGPLALARSGAEPVRLPADTRFVRSGALEFTAAGKGIVLKPLYHLLDPAVDRDKGWRRQVIF